MEQYKYLLVTFPYSYVIDILVDKLRAWSTNNWNLDKTNLWFLQRSFWVTNFIYLKVRMRQSHTLRRLPHKLDYNYLYGMQYGLIHWGEGWDMFHGASCRRFSNGIIRAIKYGFGFHHQGNSKHSDLSYIMFYAPALESLCSMCCTTGTFIHSPTKTKSKKQKKKVHFQYTCTEPKYPYPPLLKCIPPSISKSSCILTNDPTET